MKAEPSPLAVCEKAFSASYSTFLFNQKVTHAILYHFNVFVSKLVYNWFKYGNYFTMIYGIALSN
jgi:hypothetical protein